MDGAEGLMGQDNDLDDSNNSTRVKKKMHMGLQFPLFLNILGAKFSRVERFLSLLF